MKKKILSFILAICLIIPCAFMMTACGSKTVDLSGKTIAINEITDMNWDAISLYVSYQDSEDNNKSYNLDITSDDNAFENADAVKIMKSLAGASDNASIDELKTKIQTVVFNNAKNKSHVLKFNDNASKVNFYQYSEGNLDNVVKTYDVEFFKLGDTNQYYLRQNDERTGDVLTVYAKDNISVGGTNFIPIVEFDISSLNIEVTLTPLNGVGESKTVLLSDCSYARLSFHVEYTYKVVE